jgi:uncharacterized protein (UPF0276 family)
VHLPELGVGLVYSSALEPLLLESPELIDVIEIEPQTLWLDTGEKDNPYRVHQDVEKHLAGLPGRKLVHSVGTPVGGSVRSHAAQIPLLRRTIETLQAPWASEHLSFNLTDDCFTGFFLPPRQTAAGLRVYVEEIRRLRDGLGVPLAVETGVNYLRPRPDEMPDGEFMAAVAEQADCGILLDLHNVYANQYNGRQTVAQFLSQLPLDRVWEIHLAGGFEMEGFWLDAHSGAIPEPLLQISREVIPQLPNLKAVIFEIFASFLPHVGLDAVRQEVIQLRDLWDLRNTGTRSSTAARTPSATPAGPKDGIAPRDWENALGRLVVGRQAQNSLQQQLLEDPGVPLVQELVKEFRASMVVQVYRLTSRLLMLALGPDIFRALLEDFWSQTPPCQFASREAEAFGDYLMAKNLRLPQLQNILAFERATIHTLADGQTRVAHFDVDPLPMLRALTEGRLLENPGDPGDYEIEVVPDGPMSFSSIS